MADFASTLRTTARALVDDIGAYAKLDDEQRAQLETCCTYHLRAMHALGMRYAADVVRDQGGVIGHGIVPIIEKAIHEREATAPKKPRRPPYYKKLAKGDEQHG